MGERAYGKIWHVQRTLRGSASPECRLSKDSCGRNQALGDGVMEDEIREIGGIQLLKDLPCPANTLGLYFLNSEEPMEFLNQEVTSSVLILPEQITFREQSLLS